MKRIQVETTPDYSDNASMMPEGTQPCAVCGRPVRTTDRTRYLHMSTAWEAIHPSEPDDVPDSQGGWPIGPDCLKRHPELKEYARP